MLFFSLIYHPPVHTEGENTQESAKQSFDWAQYKTKCSNQHLAVVSAPPPLPLILDFVFSMGLDLLSSADLMVLCHRSVFVTNRTPGKLIPYPRELNFRCCTLIIAIALRVLRRHQSRVDECWELLETRQRLIVFDTMTVRSEKCFVFKIQIISF